MCSVQNGSVHNALDLPVCNLFHLLPGIVGLNEDPTSFSSVQHNTRPGGPSVCHSHHRRPTSLLQTANPKLAEISAASASQIPC